MSDDKFIKPVHQVIRHLVSRQEQGGDFASAQIAVLNRKSRIVRNIAKPFSKTEDPLVLLGDPGTGKTMTLQQTALALASSESHRVFPIIPLYVRLGEFHVGGEWAPTTFWPT